MLDKSRGIVDLGSNLDRPQIDEVRQEKVFTLV